MNEEKKSKQRKSLPWDTMLYKGLLALAVVLPFFILPLRGIAPEVGKILLVEVGAILLLLVWLGKQMGARKFIIHRSPIGIGFLAFSVVAVLASLMSQDFGLSFFGENFTASEGLFLASLGILGFLATQVFRSFQRVVALYTTALLPFVAIALFQILRFIIGPQFLSFGVLNSNITTLVGGWNDFGLYAGFAMLVALVGIEFLKLRSSYQKLLYVVIGFAAFGLLLVNVPLAWLAVAIGSFLVFLYRTAFRTELSGKEKWRLPVASLAVFLFALFGYIFLGNLAQSGLSLIRSVNYNEVRLSLGATASTVGEAWAVNPLTGVGPNHFGYLWQETRNEIISRITFSDVRFQYGYSAVITWFGTMGILGGLLFLLLMARFLRAGFKTMVQLHEDRLHRFFTLSAFILTLYLWLLLFIYVPGPTLITYAFLFLGVFAGLLSSKKETPAWSVRIVGEKRYAVTVLILFILAILLGGTLYLTAKKAAGMLAFRQAVFADNVQLGYEKGLQASRLTKSAPYYRALSNLVRQQAGVLASQVNIDENEEARSQLEFFLGQTLTFAQQATQANPYDYRNWQLLGDVYTGLDSYNVAGAYLDARQAYERALERNPRAHDVLARVVNLELTQGNLDEAQQLVNAMVLRRPNDVQALVLGARVSYEDEREGDGDLYINEAVRMSGANFSSLMQIGILSYNQGRYPVAQDVFQRALVVNPTSLEAALALAYTLDASGQTDEAEEIVEGLIAEGRLQQAPDTNGAPEQLPLEVENVTDAEIADTAEEGIVDPDTEVGEPVSIDESSDGE